MAAPLVWQVDRRPGLVHVPERLSPDKRFVDRGCGQGWGRRERPEIRGIDRDPDGPSRLLGRVVVCGLFVCFCLVSWLFDWLVTSLLGWSYLLGCLVA